MAKDKRPRKEAKLRRSDCCIILLCVNKFGLHQFFGLYLIVVIISVKKSGIAYDSSFLCLSGPKQAT